MAYTKTNWNNNTAPYINNTNLNHIEQGIYDNDTAITKTTNVIGYDEYDSTSTYNVGDYCIYNNMLFKCLVEISTAEEFNSNHWDVTSINEVIKEVESSVATNTNKIETITTGTATMSSTYTQNVENNHYEKVGHIVSVEFTFRAKGTWGNTIEFISGLPKAKANTRFTGINTSTSYGGYNMRFVITQTGTIQNAYSQTLPNANDVIEGHVTYISTD